MGNSESQERDETVFDGASGQFITNDLTAAAFSAVLDRPVVTEKEYDQNKDDPYFAKAEILDLQKISSYGYEPALGKFGDVFGENGDKITVILKTLSGREIPLTVGSDSYVEEVKYLLEEQEGIPVDNDRLILMYSGRHMKEGTRISDYKVSNKCVINFTPSLKASAQVPVVLNNNVLDPTYDFDYTNLTDDGKEYKRGDYKYYRPFGWKRIALKVKGKYEDDVWLGSGGMREESSSGEWPVTYHGTQRDYANSIAKKGYDLSKSHRFKYGVGVYSTPFVEVAEGYAAKFNFNGKSYKVVFQNRVCPQELVVIPGERTGDQDYWIQPDDTLIRPYGLCFKQC